jgi:hypothetical protein
MLSTRTERAERQNLARIIIGILVFGSIWGLFEATLGGFLNLVLFPNKGAIMAGIGMAIMGTALAIYRRPAMLAGIGIVAASFKLFNAWLLFVPLNAVQVINPAMAIIFESLAFALIAAFLMKRITTSSLAGIGAGALAGFISATAYVYFAIYVTHSDKLGRVITTPQAFITNQGVMQAAFFGIFLPLGILLGQKLAAMTLPALTRRSLYYAASAAVICFCWGISTLAVLAGL